MGLFYRKMLARFSKAKAQSRKFRVCGFAP